MSKYIDAEKLIAEIEGRIKLNQMMLEKDSRPSDYGRIEEGRCILRFVERIQQEQPPTEREIAEAHRYAEMIRERDRARIQQEQPEVDLNEEIDRFLKSEESTTYENAGSYKVAVKDLKKIARHFYELGLNARK